MGACCVDGCEPDDKDDVSYFPVPIAPALRRKWREAINPSTKLHQDSKICSKHFHSSEYECVRGKLRLKGRVVPSLFNHVSKKESTPPPSPAPLAPSDPRGLGAGAPLAPSDTGGLGAGAPPAPPAESNEDRVIDDKRDEDQHMPALSVPEFGLLDTGAGGGVGGEGDGEGGAGGDHDDSAECTIECVPEAILHEESDSHSEAELHKEDIEDIIANYHIQQHSKLNARHKDSGESETGDTGGKETAIDSTENEKPSEEKQDANGNLEGEKEKEKEKEISKDDDDVTEVPEFVEFSVDNVPGRGRGRGRRRGGGQSPGAGDDCLIVLENVQVDIDPALLLHDHHEHDNELEHAENNRLEIDSDDDQQNIRRGEAISLLTSSDESDVIIQEQHIDTVEVSSETDEDDKPLVTLVKAKVKEKPTRLTRLLWGNLTEYYCFQCKFTTLSKTEHQRHKLEHSKILFVCEICNFTCASKSQFSRHKKKHRLEKRFKCNLCDYKARHNMSLIYHMKSHEGITVDDIQTDKINNIKDKFQCSDCKFNTNSRRDMLRHVKTCVKTKAKNRATHTCDECDYTTKRRNDLKRHRERKHGRSSFPIAKRCSDTKGEVWNDDDED